MIHPPIVELFMFISKLREPRLFMQVFYLCLVSCHSLLAGAKLFRNIQIFPKKKHGQIRSETFAVLCIGNTAGEVALYTSGLSLLCRCSVRQHSATDQHPSSKIHILKVSA